MFNQALSSNLGKSLSYHGLGQLSRWARQARFYHGMFITLLNGTELSCLRSKAYTMLNVKWLYISHVVVFEAGSALCGGAPNMNALIVGRAIA